MLLWLGFSFEAHKNLSWADEGIGFCFVEAEENPGAFSKKADGPGPHSVIAN